MRVDPNKPVLGFVTQHCCIRVVKEAYCLRKKGYKIRLFTHRVPSYEQIFFDDINIHKSRKLLKELVKQNEDVDIWHVHNEPTNLVQDVVEMTDKPVVFDVHDLHACRVGEEIDEHFRASEQRAFDECSGVIHVSEPYGDYGNKFYNYTGPSTVVYSSTPVDWYQKPKNNGGGVVYEGGMHTPLSLKNSPHKDRDFSALAQHFMEAEVPLYFYSAVGEGQGLFYKYGWGVNWMGSRDHFRLLSELRQYGWGLILFPEKSNQVRWGMPNKLFDYLAAGIPIIGTKDTCFGDFIAENGLGINLSYYDDIPELPDPQPYRENVLKVRDSLSMDNEIKKVERLYDQVL